ncbi:Stk1 family PASTA domain-containing Ser/Thr kinase [Occultella glacieicola]|uniref:non-specific serine/threonine protein kinase n=1 Tax=Occultella glacieicola TaxID=2518684 RepID=A0ABY2E890_9MICO|nr:Stk1 family PASTA domain-containing Ser/Thr kinase [Occultella glacieicola]TDE98730.1 Stk1 family PASTA domain-containing Ser/Thr kinase [Occultella glacieicola]
MVDDVPRVLAGRYEIGELIGRGGMAEVHIGRDNRLGRSVAIKMLRPDLARDPSFHARFRREAQAAASLNHPAIVSVYDTGEDLSSGIDGAEVRIPFIVMEYVEGHTVRDLLRDGSALPIDEAIEITQGVLSALEYSHHAGIVHRDIKPANVMLTPTGAVKVMDFGIARAMADSAATMTQTHAVVGTAQYLSPEQARGEVVDARSDLYSTGCLLFELLTGRPPFIGDSAVAVAYQHVSEEPPRPSTFAPDVPESLDRITMLALAKDRDERYSSAAQFRGDLEAAARQEAISAPPLGAVSAAAATGATQVLGGAAIAEPTAAAEPEPEDEPKSNKTLIWILAVVGVAALIGIILLALNRPEEPVEPTTVMVPDLTSMTQEQARTALADTVATEDGPGLELVLGDPVTDPEIPEGEAVSWNPTTGAEVEAGSPVTVVFSSGPGEFEIPDVSGLSQDRARQELIDAGFSGANIRTTTENSPDFGADEAIRTEPEAGTMANPEDAITIVLATGNVDLPSLVGQDLEAAQNTITELGLSSRVTNQEDPGPPGVVLNQDREGSVPQGTVVELIVSIPEPTQEPTTDPPTTDPTTDPTTEPTTEPTPDPGGEEPPEGP